MEWIPGTGPMTLVMAATGLYALAITTLSMLASWPGRYQDRPGWMMLATLIALLGAAVAFLAGHFLLRYAALEIVALCVAIAPLLVAPDEVSSRQTSWAVYLLFRVGDAGLLAAILALYGRVGTLDIDAALAASTGLAAPRLNLIAAGFALAVWIKIGLWPFSIWLQAGRRLSNGLYAWLYLTLMPNLGLYLLYKVIPLLAVVGPAQRATLWIGAAGAAISAILAFVQADDEIALWSVQGGVILWAAALGLKPPVWISLILWTPLRLLSVWAFRRTGRRAAAALFGLALLLSAWDGLILAWSGSAEPGRFWIQLAVALSLFWLVRRAWQIWRQATPLSRRAEWLVGGMSALILIGLGVSVGPLLAHLLTVAHAELPAGLGRLAWLRALVWTPAWIPALVLAWGAHTLSQKADRVTPSPGRMMNILQEMAGTIRTVVEKGLLENAIGLAMHSLMGLSAWLYRWLETNSLEDSLHQMVRAGQWASNWLFLRLETGGLDALLYRIADLVQTVGRSAQRLHTGRLRINLAWVALGLILATLSLVFWAG